MIDDDGAVFITVFGQGIDFTEKIERGLINPNKCRSFGVQFFDNPTDTTRELVFMPIIFSFHFTCKELIA